eukprot:2549484-Pleurochrysis_carterae.AAC.1
MRASTRKGKTWRSSSEHAHISSARSRAIRWVNGKGLLYIGEEVRLRGVGGVDRQAPSQAQADRGSASQG